MFQRSNFSRVLKRICRTKDTLAILNPHGLRILIRYNEPDEDQTDLAFDIAVYANETDHAHIRKALENNVSPFSVLGEGIEDGENIYVLDEFVVSEDFEPRETFNDAVELLNSIWTWKVCSCGQYFIKDTDLNHTPASGESGEVNAHCLFCELKGEQLPGDLVCTICCETLNNTSQVIQLPCCGKTIDGLCYHKCRGSCPFCRQALARHPEGLHPINTTELESLVVDAVSETR